MRINREIEKMFIDEQHVFDKEIENIFYQKETNTFEYYELDSYLELLEACVTNAYACEFYLEHSYKYLREFLKINNSLLILGATKDEPQLLVCIEMMKSLVLKIKDLKTKIITYHILLNNTINYQPSHSLNETLNITLYYNNKIKNPKTPQIMFEYSIKSLFRAELCFEALDYLIDYYFINYQENLKLQIDNYEITKEIENVSLNLLDDFLDFKFNYIMSLNLE